MLLLALKGEVFKIIDAKKGTDVYLFIEKLKPALLLGINHKYTEDLKKDYSYFMADDLRIIFYHEESSKEQFNKLNRRKKDLGMAIGVVLGYPPYAIELFGNDIVSNEEHPPMRVDYHGQMFVTSTQKYKEDLIYLLEHMPIPKEHQTFIELSAKSQPDGSFDIVKRININN